MRMSIYRYIIKYDHKDESFETIPYISLEAVSIFETI